MKKIFLIIALAIMPAMMLGQNPGVNHWEDTWGVRYWFQVGGGSNTGLASLIVKADSARFSKPIKFDKAISVGRVADATTLISVNGLAAHANLLKLANEDGTARITADSAGNLTVAGTLTYNAVIDADGISTIQGLSIGTLQNSQLANLTITNYGGTSQGTWDTTGLIATKSLAIGIGQNTKLNTFTVEDFDGTDVATIDTTGKATVDTLVVDGNARIGGLAAYGSRLSVENDAVNTHIFSLYNSRNTALFQIDSNGVQYSSIAGIDSFTTTAAVDSVLLPAGSGLTNFSKPTITQLTPVHSTEIDTAIYTGSVVVTGDGDTMLVVTRAKSYTGNGATAVKSAAIYSYDIKK